MSGSRTRRLMGLTVWALAVPTGLLHILFGLANFQPGFPKLEGVAAITAGLAILASVAVARRSLSQALLTAFFGTLPMAAWFAYAVPVEGSSDPVFWASRILPTGTGLSALKMSRRAKSGRHR